VVGGEPGEGVCSTLEILVLESGTVCTEERGCTEAVYRLPPPQRNYREGQDPPAAYLGDPRPPTGVEGIYEDGPERSVQPPEGQRRGCLEDRVHDTLRSVRMSRHAIRFDERASDVPALDESGLPGHVRRVCGRLLRRHIDLLRRSGDTRRARTGGAEEATGERLVCKGGEVRVRHDGDGVLGVRYRPHGGQHEPVEGEVGAGVGGASKYSRPAVVLGVRELLSPVHTELLQEDSRHDGLDEERGEVPLAGVRPRRPSSPTMARSARWYWRQMHRQGRWER
jgi:hypothetical protein